MATLQLKVDGVWLSSIAGWGDLEWSTFEHGSDELSWAMEPVKHRSLRGQKRVELWYGSGCLWGGILNEPDRDAGEFTAKGLGHLPEGRKALNAAGNASSAPNVSIDQAIVRGMPWQNRVESFSSTSQSDDLLGELPTLQEVLDVWADDNNKFWAASPAGIPFSYTAPAAPSYHLLRGQTLGASREQYATTLIGRYRTAAGGYDTRYVTDADAAARWDSKEEGVDMTVLGAIPTTRVDSILTNLLAKGRARLGWTGSLEVDQGELYNAGGVPVDLNTLSVANTNGRLVVRQHNVWDDTRELNGRFYADIPIARTIHKATTRTVELEPVQMDAVTLEDMIASLPKR